MEVLEKRGYVGFIKIDAGGQATVYKSTLGEMIVAIKVVRIDNPETKLEDDLQRELQIGRNVKHSNLVQVLELFRTRTKIYIVMPFAENGTIGSLVRNQTVPGLCEANIQLWFCPITNAVHYLHKNLIAHRDIKLDNILLDRDHNPLLTDFGFSRFVGKDKQGRVIKSDTFCGTTSYNPPEILNEQPYNPFKGDIWCLGVALFILYNKDYPFDRHQGREKMHKAQMNRAYKLLPQVEDKISHTGKNLIDLMLEPNPDTRIDIITACKHDFIPLIFRVDDPVVDVQTRFHRVQQKGCYSKMGSFTSIRSGASMMKTVKPSKVPDSNVNDAKNISAFTTTFTTTVTTKIKSPLGSKVCSKVNCKSPFGRKKPDKK